MPRHAARLDAPAMLFDDLAHDGEAEPGSFAAGGVKGLKNPLQHFGAHADAGIAHPDAGDFCLFFGVDRNSSTFWHGMDGIHQ